MDILEQLLEALVTEEDLSGNKRRKWFPGGLASAIGSLFSIGISSCEFHYHWCITKTRANIDEEIPEIQQQQLQNLDQMIHDQ